MKFNLINGGPWPRLVAVNGGQICGCCGAEVVTSEINFLSSNIGYTVYWSIKKEIFSSTDDYYVDETILPDGTYLYVKINTQESEEASND
jgi:hypothetical protein